MKIKEYILVFLLAVPIHMMGQHRSGFPASGKGVQQFDSDWLFIREDLPEGERPELETHGWKKINLPHDWSIDDLPFQKKDSIVGPFDRTSIGKSATGFTVGGTGWYRKKFSVSFSFL
ncbi:hypothetical protein [Sphingobacterium sp. DR205]|uniref:hypothetical protein n=1 Tax=Sphingobacterium sp. DR205 TaxID=2713573 RepID=UPI001F49B616|nr:hypothetical protein [Sphingobacterium sp. DR205]